MRMMPDRYALPRPNTVKRAPASLRHISAPLKGLSLSSKLVTGDPLTATILDNFVIEENQVKCRAGTALVYTHPAGQPVAHLVPHYGTPNKMAAATAGELRLFSGGLVKGGFASDDWSWTAFSNLSAVDYTVMVNGFDGVWSWDGSNSSTSPAAVPVTNLSKGNPAICTVSAGNIGQFSNGMLVTIAGAVGTGLVNANGAHVIASVGTPANTFQLVGVDTSTASGPQTSGVTATPPSTGVVKETVTAPAAEPWINPDSFNIVCAHQNRLWFADADNLAVYYLPIQQKSGEVAVLPLNAIFARGGTIRAIQTWTTDGAVNVNDMFCVFSSNGECAIYSGVDPGPDGDFALAGVYRFDAPMSKHCVQQYGGELYVLISTGLVPMSTLMRAESEQLGQSDRNIFSFFFNTAVRTRDRPGWQVFLNPSSGRMIANLPNGGVNNYRQAVRFMPNPIWATWSAIPSRCWGWLDSYVYCGTDDGRVLAMHPSYLNDCGQPIRVDVQAAWSYYGSPTQKFFKMVLPYLSTDGSPVPSIDIKVDYDMSAPGNQPDVSYATPGGGWDDASWDTDGWAGGFIARNYWTGVGVIGRVGAPRLTALVRDCQFSLTGWDVLYETGSVFG